jgi:hypothetical protein
VEEQFDAAARLLKLSDVFGVGADGRAEQLAAELPRIELDRRFYGAAADFEARFQAIPSLRHANSLAVRGDWSFPVASEVLGDVVLPDTGKPQNYPADMPTVLGVSAAQYLASQEAARNEIAQAEARPPTARTELDADERRLLREVPPHHGR